MNIFGNAFRIEIFGESHGPAIGCTLDGLPAGFKPSFEQIRSELTRRAPRKSVESTRRQENDDFEIISGLYNDLLTGAPLTVIFKNKDARPNDYADSFARPSHADFPAYVKYSGFNDPRGGGMFSGRMTLPLVFAGAICKQLIERNGIVVTSHIDSIGTINDKRYSLTMEDAPELDPMFPLIDESKRPLIEELFSKLRKEGNTVGSSVECAVLHIPCGIGEPFFDSIESMLSHLLFSIPGVHGVEFGAGFGFSNMLGTTANDSFIAPGVTGTNNSGGINGGISNGMPIVFRAAFRPIPSVAIEQTGIDLNTGNPMCHTISGRHDVCILPRGCAVVESAAAICIYDLMLRGGFQNAR